LPAIVDTGADVTMLPLNLLTSLGEGSIGLAYLRSAWGARTSVQLFIVDLQVEAIVLPGITVAATEQTTEAILGRDVLNRLVLVLDGPRTWLDMFENRPVRLPPVE
jgi:predicted aspartyl protease